MSLLWRVARVVAVVYIVSLVVLSYLLGIL